MELVHAVQISYEMKAVGVVGAVRREGQQVLDDALKEANMIDPSVPIICQLAESKPAAALLRASEGAEFLAIGARGRGGFKGLALGHVGEQCANNAHCTVVIVRGEHNPLTRSRKASTAVKDVGA